MVNIALSSDAYSPVEIEHYQLPIDGGSHRVYGGGEKGLGVTGQIWSFPEQSVGRATV